ncbi:helix-turn-helix domain-containing protein [Marinilactibacillus kalidii]|uniref:helix-turn-helix domain-containing protein n=1 Tax=Marinilactibacillus kalidii TaxID=2820274 RepID=UPI001ABE8E14|nr:helix-turn-helix domain-containing protein [Marinilactibacillus kalidii]
MFDIISDKEKRKVDIIKILYYSENSVTLTDLHDRVGLSIRGLHYNLKEIETDVSVLGGEILTSKKGYKLILPSNIGMDYFERKIIKSSVGFQLLERLFHENSLTSDEIQESLFVSPSSLFRTTKLVNKLLPKYGLSLETNPYKLAGSEELIRKFYVRLFYEAYGEQEWPFVNINLDLVHKLITEFLEDVGIDRDSTSVPKLRIFLGIHLTRVPEKISLEEIFQDSKELQKVPIDLVKDTEMKVAQWFKTKKYPTEFIDRYSLSFSILFIFFSGIHLDRTPSHIETDRLKIIETYLRKIEFMLGLENTNFTALIYNLNHIFANYSIHSKLNILEDYLLFKPREYSMIDALETNYPLFFKVFVTNLTNLIEEMNLTYNDLLLEELLYYAISKWPNLFQDLFYKYSGFTILVYSHLTDLHKKHFLQGIDSQVEKNVVVLPFNENFLDEKSLKNYTFDMIITSSTVFLDITQPIIYLPSNHSLVNYDPFIKATKKIKRDKQHYRKLMLEKNIYDLKNKFGL